MIQYHKHVFNLNLLIQLHGSAIYRAALPGILSVGIFCQIHYLFQGLDKPLFEDPTTVGILVGSIALIITFRVNQAYQRYWEACSRTFGMMSKWMDAAVHTACYHLQSQQYDTIKPPSYFDHPELNANFMTRDRERTHARSREERNDRAITRSIEYVEDRKRAEQYAGNHRRQPLDAAKNPIPLFGIPKLDGGWEGLFPNQRPQTSTYIDPAHPNDSPPGDYGFASTKGGRTPSLFLQELVHLTSLLNAVALATLRNDIDGAESPLDVYEPGSPWPSVDSTELVQKGLWVKFLMGVDRTPQARTLYNACRPIPVLGGVSDSEIHFLQMARGPQAKTYLCWKWLSEFIVREHLSGSQGEVQSPIISQTIQWLGEGMTQYSQASKITFFPFPFPHAQLSAFYAWVAVIAIPLVLAQFSVSLWLGAVVSFFTTTCLVGLHEVARELENPFRNVPNDIPLCTLQAQFNEALITSYAGYHPDAYWDVPGINGMTAHSTQNGKETRHTDQSKTNFNDTNQQREEELLAVRAEIERLKKLLEEMDGEEKKD